MEFLEYSYINYFFLKVVIPESLVIPFTLFSDEKKLRQLGLVLPYTKKKIVWILFLNCC